MRETVTTQLQIFPQDSVLTPISSSSFHFNLLGFQEDYNPLIKVPFHPFFTQPRVWFVNRDLVRHRICI